MSPSAHNRACSPSAVSRQHTAINRAHSRLPALDSMGRPRSPASSHRSLQGRGRSRKAVETVLPSAAQSSRDETGCGSQLPAAQFDSLKRCARRPAQQAAQEGGAAQHAHHGRFCGDGRQPGRRGHPHGRIQAWRRAAPHRAAAAALGDLGPAVCSCICHNPCTSAFSADRVSPAMTGG